MIGQTPTPSGTDAAVIAAVVVVAFLLSRIVRPLLGHALAVVARRSANGRGSLWQTRAQRLLVETTETAELRRRQRVDATATGLARMFSTVIVVLAVFIILERLQIDLAYVISGAGFLGVAVSIGAQHMVNDFATGIHILLEDRFGAGDNVIIRVADTDHEVTVVSLHSFATRFENEEATFHLANRELTIVRNLSQRGIRTDVLLPAEIAGSRASVEKALRDAYHRSTGFDVTRDGLILDKIVETDAGTVATIRTARSLSHGQRNELGATTP